MKVNRTSYFKVNLIGKARLMVHCDCGYEWEGEYTDWENFECNNCKQVYINCGGVRRFDGTDPSQSKRPD